MCRTCQLPSSRSFDFYDPPHHIVSLGCWLINVDDTLWRELKAHHSALLWSVCASLCVCLCTVLLLISIPQTVVSHTQLPTSRPAGPCACLSCPHWPLTSAMPPKSQRIKLTKKSKYNMPHTHTHETHRQRRMHAAKSLVESTQKQQQLDVTDVSYYLFVVDFDAKCMLW